MQIVADFSARANLDASGFTRGAEKLADSLATALRDNEVALSKMQGHYRRAMEDFVRASNVPMTSGSLAKLIRQFEKLEESAKIAFVTASSRVEQASIVDPNRGLAGRRVDMQFQQQQAEANAQAARDEQTLLARNAAIARADLEQRQRLSSQYWQQQFSSIDREIAERQRSGMEFSKQLQRQMQLEEAKAEEARNTERALFQQAEAIKEAVNPTLRLVKLRAELTKLVDRGLLSDKQAAAYMQMRAQTIQFEAGSRAASRYGMYLQQAGYQIQDFAVQVASGTNALVAFSQQGSQMLGVFGRWGAIAGAAVSLGVLIYRLYNMEDAAKKAKDAIEALRQEQEKFVSLTDSNRKRDVEQMSLAEQRVIAERELTAALAERQRAVHALVTAGRRLEASEYWSSSPRSNPRRGGRPMFEVKEPLRLRRDNTQQLAAFKQAEADATAAANRALERQNALLEIQRKTVEQLKSASEERLRDMKEAADIMASMSFDLMTPSEQIASLTDKLRFLEEDGKNVSNSPEAAKLVVQLYELQKAQQAAADAIKASLDPLYAEEQQRKRLNDLVKLGLLTNEEVEQYLAKQRGNANRVEAARQTPFNDMVRRGLLLGTAAAMSTEPVLETEAKKQTVYLASIARSMEIWRN
jgi:hypothetical protein